MTKIASASFEIQGWNEEQYAEVPGAPKMTRATVKKVYNGDIEGEGNLEYLMSYAPDGSASFVGMERFVGTLGGRQGSFVFQHIGAFKDGTARSAWSVVPGSGTGGLVGLRGELSSSLGHGKNYPIEFNYELP
jgi:hypothetical protein